jgi:hypothetical protein
MNGKYQRRSTLGRPRTVTDAQIQETLTWHANRQTIDQKARQMGLTRNVIAYIIHTGGSYKQPSPEHRTANLINDNDRAHRADLIAGNWL